MLLCLTAEELAGSCANVGSCALSEDLEEVSVGGWAKGSKKGRKRLEEFGVWSRKGRQ